MATEAFTYGDAFKFEPAETMFFNGEEGRIWIKSGRSVGSTRWVQEGRAHMKMNATPQDVVNRFCLFWIPSLVNA